MTENNSILNFLEKIFLSIIFFFVFSRYAIGRFFSKIIYDTDFKVLNLLEKLNYFNKKELILDIGANDGMSYKIMKKFSKKTKIISFEPNSDNFKKIKEYEKKISNSYVKKLL